MTGGAQMPPGSGQDAATQRYVVLLQTTETALEEGSEDWTYITDCGHIDVPLGRQKKTVLATLLEGQGDPEAGVPQLPLAPGQEGQVYLVPDGEMWPGTTFRARNRLVVEPAA